MSAAFPLTSPIEVTGTGGAPGQVNFSDGTNVVEVKAPTTLSGTVSFTLPDANGTANQVLKWPVSGSTTVWENSSGNATGTLPVSFNFVAPNGSPSGTSSSTFQSINTFIYNGTILDNTMSAAICVAQTSNTAATGQVQLIDLTNSMIIATSAVFGPTNSAPIIIDFGVVSNLPTGQSMLEVQIRKLTGAGGGAAEIRSFQCY